MTDCKRCISLFESSPRKPTFFTGTVSLTANFPFRFRFSVWGTWSSGLWGNCWSGLCKTISGQAEVTDWICKKPAGGVSDSFPLGTYSRAPICSLPGTTSSWFKLELFCVDATSFCVSADSVAHLVLLVVAVWGSTWFPLVCLERIPVNCFFLSSLISLAIEHWQNDTPTICRKMIKANAMSAPFVITPPLKWHPKLSSGRSSASSRIRIDDKLKIVHAIHVARICNALIKRLCRRSVCRTATLLTVRKEWMDIARIPVIEAKHVVVMGIMRKVQVRLVCKFNKSKMQRISIKTAKTVSARATCAIQ